MFSVGEVDQRCVKRGRLSGNGSLMEGFSVRRGTNVKGELSLEACMEHDGIVVVTEVLQTLNQRFHPLPVALKHGQRVLNQRDADRQRSTNLGMVWKANLLEKRANIVNITLVRLVEQAVVEPLNSGRYQPATGLDVRGLVELSVQQPLGFIAPSFDQRKTVRQFVSHRFRANVVQVVTNLVRLLSVKRDSPRPVVQIFVIRSPLSGPIVNNGQGSALLRHESIEMLLHQSRGVSAVQSQVVVEVQNGVSRLVEVRCPVLSRLLVKRSETLVAEHCATHVPDEVLNLDVAGRRRPTQQCPIVQFIDERSTHGEIGR